MMPNSRSAPLSMRADAACVEACGSNHLLIAITWRVAAGFVALAPIRKAPAPECTLGTGKDAI
jgi:hypothetical protein